MRQLQPTISVVIPAHNAAGTLARAMSSVQSQSLSASEVIVVNDGSSDDTAEVVSRFNGVVCIAIPNGGPAVARNVGWQNAMGDWIAFLDADDRWLVDKLERVSRAISSDSNVGVVYSDAIRVVNGIPTRRWSDDAQPHAGAVLAGMLCGNFVCQSSAVVRRDAMLRVGGYDESFLAWEDIDLWLRLARHERFAYVDEVLVEYHMSGPSVSGRVEAMAEGRWRSVTAALSWPEVQALPPDVRQRALKESLLQLGHAHYLVGRDVLARRTLRGLVLQAPGTMLDPRLIRPYVQSFLPSELRKWLRDRRHAPSTLAVTDDAAGTTGN